MTSVPLAAPTRIAPDEAHAMSVAIAEVVRDGPWIGGPVVAEFEREFAAFLGFGDVVGCASGTDALALALGALALPAASSVLVPANDDGYAAVAARLCGLEPIAMDVDELTMAPTVETAERVRRSDTSAVIVTHLHGDPVDLTQIDRWRREHGLLLIEDCAQAHGARREGRHVGSVGDAAAFSFYPTKNLGAVGDAGAIVFADVDTAVRARRLAQYGWDPRPTIAHAGGRNSRLDPIQAAVLLARLPFLESRNSRRRGILTHYRAAAPNLDFAGDPELTVAHHAVLRLDDRDALVAELAASGIASGIHYSRVLGEMPGLGLAAGPESTPVALRLASRIVSVPCDPELTDDEVECVATALTLWAHRRQDAS